MLRKPAADRVAGWVAARVRSHRWMWLLPPVVLYARMRSPTTRIAEVVAGLVAVAILAWGIRWPGRALVALIVFLPLQALGFGFLLALGVPAQVLRPAGGLKELLALAIVLSAAHELRVGRTRFRKRAQLDNLDKALLVYVGVVTLYLFLPHLFTRLPVSGRVSVRLLAWRADCGYVMLFFGVRHAPIPRSTRRYFVAVVFALAAVTALFGFYQWLRPDSWAHLVLVTGHQPQYQLSVLQNTQATVARNLGYLTARNPLRIASVFISPFDMADFLLIPLAIVVAGISQDYPSRARYVLGAAILGLLFGSRVRADAVAAVVIVGLALVPRPNRPLAARLRLLAAVSLAAAAVIPALGGTRFLNAQGGAQSNQGHINELSAGLTQLARFPLGLGIGNAAGVGDRFVQGSSQQGRFTVDNSVLQVGDELGIQALIPWLVMMGLTWRKLGRADKESDPFAGGVHLAFLAIVVAGMYHHVFLGFPVAWTLWAAVGLALASSGRPDAPIGEPLTDTIGAIDATPADRQS